MMWNKNITNAEVQHIKKLNDYYLKPGIHCKLSQLLKAKQLLPPFLHLDKLLFRT